MATVNCIPQSWPPIVERHPLLAAELGRSIRELADGGEHSYSLYPLEVLCRFLSRVEQRFPGLQMSCLRCYEGFEPLGSPKGEQSIVGFLWQAESILQAGLATAEELPQGGKRVHYGEGDAMIDSAIKRRSGLVEVHACVCPDVAADHPLAFFSSASVRSLGARPLLRLVVGDTVREPKAPQERRPTRRIAATPTAQGLEQQLLEAFRRLTRRRQTEIITDLALEVLHGSKEPQP